MTSELPPEFIVKIDYDRCRRCKRCVMNCSFGCMHFTDRVVPEHKSCVACQRCVTFCPEHAITITKNELAYKENANWSPEIRKNILKQAETGGILLTGMGNPRDYPIIWDHLLIDACQVTNPSIDPLREPMELRTFLGRKPDHLEFVESEDGEIDLATEIEPQVRLDVPVVFGAMSYGAVSLNVHRSLAMAAARSGTLMNTGEGGLHRELYPYSGNVIVQVASGRFGVHSEYLNTSAMVEIKIGQGAKPGIGGHLPGEKVDEDISGLNRGEGTPIAGNYLGTGMHGGVIYIRGEVDEYTLGKEVSVLPPDAKDMKVLTKHLKEYCEHFGLDPDEIMSEPFIKLQPVSSRPYGDLYAY